MHAHLKRSPQLLFFILAIGINGVAIAQSDDILDVYDRALDYDAVLRAELATRDAVGQGIDIAAADRRLRVDLSASASVNDSEKNSSWDDSTFALSAVQPIYNRAANQSVDRARTDIESAELSVQEAKQQLVLRVAAGYLDVLRAQASLRVSDAELDAIDRQRAQVRTQFDFGLLPNTAVLEAEAQYDLAAARRIRVDDELFDARQSLERVAGRIYEPLQALQDVEPTIWLDNSTEQDWVARALAGNPSIVQSQVNLKALNMSVNIERAARFPTLDLVAMASSNRSDQTGLQDNDLASLGVQLNLSLYGGGRVTAQIAQANALAIAANERLIEHRRLLAQEVKVKYRALRSSVQQVEANERALRSNEASYDAIDAAFRAGSRTLVDVLDALQDLISARFDLVNARFFLITDYLNLEAVAGQLDREDLVVLNNYLGTNQD